MLLRGDVWRPDLPAIRVLWVLVGVFASSASLAATRTWTGSVNGNWSVAGNWSGGAPVAGDDLVFPQTVSTYSMVNDLPPGTVFGSLSFTGTAIYTLTGNGLGLSGGIVNSGGPMLSVDVRLTAAQTFTDGLSMTISGVLDLNGNALTINGSNVTSSITTLAGPIVGTGSITMSGGYLILSGSGSFPGPLTFNGSGLRADGTFPSASVLTTAGYLRGAGTIGSLTANARVEPGFSFCSGCLDPHVPGILTSGDLVLGAASSLAIDINGPSPGTGHDQLRVNGSVTLSGGDLFLDRTVPVTLGQAFVIIDNDGADAVVGTFRGLGEGATLVSNGTVFQITYRGGTGNDVVVTAIAAVAPIPVLDRIGEAGLAVSLLLAAVLCLRRVGG